MTGEFRLRDKGNGLENAAVLFYRLTMITDVLSVARHAIRAQLKEVIARKPIIVKYSTLLAR